MLPDAILEGVWSRDDRKLRPFIVGDYTCGARVYRGDNLDYACRPINGLINEDASFL